MGCSRVWGPQHSSRKQESGYLEKGGFELDFKGLSHQEGNEIKSSYIMAYLRHSFLICKVGKTMLLIASIMIE